MTALLRIIPLWLWFATAGICGSVLSYVAGAWHGSKIETAQAEARGAQATINAMKDRGLINEAVRNMDDCQLLIELGGLCE